MKIPKERFLSTIMCFAKWAHVCLFVLCNCFCLPRIKCVITIDVYLNILCKCNGTFWQICITSDGTFIYYCIISSWKSRNGRFVALFDSHNICCSKHKSEVNRALSRSALLKESVNIWVWNTLPHAHAKGTTRRHGIHSPLRMWVQNCLYWACTTTQPLKYHNRYQASSLQLSGQHFQALTFRGCIILQKAELQ